MHAQCGIHICFASAGLPGTSGEEPFLDRIRLESTMSSTWTSSTSEEEVV